MDQNRFSRRRSSSTEPILLAEEEEVLLQDFQVIIKYELNDLKIIQINPHHFKVKDHLLSVVAKHVVLIYKA